MVCMHARPDRKVGSPAGSPHSHLLNTTTPAVSLSRRLCFGSRLSEHVGSQVKSSTMGWFLSRRRDQAPSFWAFPYVFLMGGKTVLKGTDDASVRSCALCVIVIANRSFEFANKGES